MKLKIFLSSLVLSIAVNGFSMPPNEAGKAIFNARCGSCHNVNKVVVGPALAGIDQRRSLEWIIKFVRSSQTMVKSGDKDAAALFTKFNIVMPDHPDLTPDNIKNVVDYIKSQAVATTVDEKPFAKPQKLHPAYLPLTLSNYGFFLTFFIAIILLIGSLLFFVQVKEYERQQTVEQ